MAVSQKQNAKSLDHHGREAAALGVVRPNLPEPRLRYWCVLAIETNGIMILGKSSPADADAVSREKFRLPGHTS
jgi:hypothetical protein